MNETVFEQVLESLQAATTFNAEVEVPPAVVLWTDKESQWSPLAPLLRDALPQFLTLGDYSPEERKGPAIWLKCAIASKLESVEFPQESVPIIYLPGVSRTELRAIEECPKPLQPLAELQYRGVYWSHPNGKDWTVLSFLVSEHGGLGLDVAQDRKTVAAMLSSLTTLASTRISDLAGKRLEAEDFHKLLTPDPERDLLRWLNTPEVVQKELAGERWEAFRQLCRSTLGFDPQSEGELVGAEKLGLREGKWNPIWQRFEDAPHSFPNIPELLDKAQPSDLISEPASSWPQNNANQEDELRAGLNAVQEMGAKAAGDEIVRLHGKHEERLNWVWRKLGQSRLCEALVPLAELVRTTREEIPGANIDQLREAYMENGWKADAAVLRALSIVTSKADQDALEKAIRAVYLPWLEHLAERFQNLSASTGIPRSPKPADAKTGECIVFADGLRYDIAKQLLDALSQAGMAYSEGFRWAVFPGVTPTAKPAVSPLVDLLEGNSTCEEFRPNLAMNGKALTPELFRKELLALGYQILTGQETGDSKGRAWTETAEIDSLGHKLGLGLASQLDIQINRIVERIRQLVDAGWKHVRLVTDHGWLFLPGGLPKRELPKFLADSRWGRCAALKSTSKVSHRTHDWHWSPEVQISVPEGIGCYRAGLIYTHGGLTLQECLIPIIEIRGAKDDGPRVGIEGVKWIGLRCRVDAGTSGAGFQIDIRKKAADPASTILGEAKAADEHGKTSVLVIDEENEGSAAVIVVLNEAGKVIAKKTTTVGGE